MVNGLGAGNLTLAAGTMNWTGGAAVGGTLSIGSGATLNMTGIVDHVLSGVTFNNSGTVNYNFGATNGFLVQAGSARSTTWQAACLTSRPTATSQETTGCAPCTFNNLGTIRKSGGTGNSDLGGVIAYNSTGGTLDSASACCAWSAARPTAAAAR